MAWVNERYAGEVAMLFTWLLALAPWAVIRFRAELPGFEPTD